MTPAKTTRPRTLTPNQVVAYNLRRAREQRGLTQEEAAELLQPFLGGERWSKATWSAAEASREPDADRIRQFDADEILAFARAFELPLGWFFMPPDEGATVSPPRSKREPISARELFELVAWAVGIEEMQDRIRETFPDRGPVEWHQEVGAMLTRSFIQATMVRGFGKLPDYARLLRAVADDAPRLQNVAAFLEALERGAAEELAAMLAPQRSTTEPKSETASGKRARRARGKR